MKTLRLILGDQLYENHSWFKNVDDNIIYLMAEMRQETDYTFHHIQKIVGFFSAMRAFADTLEKKGHRVVYFRINDDTNSQKLDTIILDTINKYNIDSFAYQWPD